MVSLGLLAQARLEMMLGATTAVAVAVLRNWRREVFMDINRILRKRSVGCARYAVNEFEGLFASYTVQICVRAEKQPIIAYSWAGIENTAIAGESVLSELLKLGFCFQYKRSSIAAD